MSSVLATFDAPVLAKDATAYIAQACGRETADGLWEGWIEFIPRDGGVSLRSPREAILDPFSLYEKSEALLRKELIALAAWHLVNILEVFGLSDLPATALQQLRRADLIELIVSGVREGAAIKK